EQHEAQNVADAVAQEVRGLNVERPLRHESKRARVAGAYILYRTLQLRLRRLEVALQVGVLVERELVFERELARVVVLGLRRLRRMLDVLVRHVFEDPDAPLSEECERRAHEERARRKVAEEIENEPGEPVIDEDVAIPQEQIAVEEAEDDQPQRASIVQRGDGRFGVSQSVTL